MFCHKCGAKALENAEFCHKCGTRLILDDAATPAADFAEQTRQRVYAPAEAAPKRPEDFAERARGPVSGPEAAPEKKSRRPVIIGVAVLAVLAVISIAFSLGDGTDYVGSVRDHRPFADSVGLAHTYGEVFDKYISDAKWDVRESGDGAYINVRGTVKGTNEAISVMLLAAPYEQDPELLVISTEYVNVGGSKLETQEEAVQFLRDMFAAYGAGADDLGGYAGGQDEGGAQGDAAEAEKDSADEAEAMKAYANRVRALAAENSDLQFALIDLTKSDILELVADSGSEISVYTWTDGEMVPIMEWVGHGLPTKTGSYSYLPGQEIIRHNYYMMAGAVGYEDYYGINSEHKLTELPMDELSIWAFEDMNGNGMPDENEPSSPRYYVGDTEVTEDVFESYQIQGDFEWLHGDKSAKEILSILNERRAQ